MVREAILKEIEYEYAEGITTPLSYHICVYCGQNPARGERCVECWRSLLNVMDQRDSTVALEHEDEEVDEIDSPDGC